MYNYKPQSGNEIKLNPGFISNIALNALKHLMTLLSQSFPYLTSHVSSITDYISKSIKSSTHVEHFLNVTGYGPRATVLRQIADVFPDKNIERIINNGLPPTFDLKDEERFVKPTKSVSENNSYIRECYSLMNLFRIPADKLGSFYIGDFIKKQLDTLVTGLYSSSEEKFYGNSPSAIEYLVLVLSDYQIYIRRKDSTETMLIYVHLEGVWASIDRNIYDLNQYTVTTDHVKYFNYKDIQKEYHKLIESINDKYPDLVKEG